MNPNDPALKKLNEELLRIQHERSLVLDGFNFLDLSISGMISQYYFSEYNENFISRVLYSPFMTSSGRIEIFRSILKEIDLYDKKMLENIQLLAKIRNNFAHSSYVLGFLYMLSEVSSGREPEKFLYFNPKTPLNEFGFDCEAEYKKFKVINDETQNKITELYKKFLQRYPDKNGSLKNSIFEKVFTSSKI